MQNEINLLTITPGSEVRIKTGPLRNERGTAVRESQRGIWRVHLPNKQVIIPEEDLTLLIQKR